MNSLRLRSAISGPSPFPQLFPIPADVAVLLWMLPGAVALRMTVAMLGYFGYDLQGLTEWMVALQQHPWDSFYQLNTTVPPDHLPGTLWLLHFATGICNVLGIQVGVFDASTYMVVKSIGMTADILSGLLLFCIVRRFGSPAASVLAAATWLWNPAPILISSFWGQLDSVSLVFVLAAILAALHARTATALLCITVAVLFKPQLAVIGLFAGVYLVVKARETHGWRPRGWWPILRGVAGSVALVTVAGWPFGVALLPGIRTWSYLDRLEFALNRYDVTSMGALNLWMIPIGTGAPPSDGTAMYGWISYALIANLLVLGSIALGLVTALICNNPEDGLLTGSTIAMWGGCIFATRMHERYFLPALLLLMLIAALNPRYRLLAVGMSCVFAANLYLAFTYFDGSYPFASLRTDTALRALSLAAVAGWVAFVCMTWKYRQTDTLVRANQTS